MAAILRRPDMAEFDSITLTEIGSRFKHNLQGTIDWCREHGLLPTSITCENCVDDIGNQLNCNIGARIW